MVQVDIPAAYAYGQLFALLSKKYLKKEENFFQNRLLGPANFFLAVCYAPVGMFLMIGWPAWEMMYVSDWVEDPFNKPAVAAFYILFNIVMILIGNIGFLLGHRWYRDGHDSRVTTGFVIGVLLTFLPFLLRWGVWWNVGTYNEVQGGGGYSFWSAPFFTGWSFIMSYMVISSVVFFIWFKKKADALTLQG